MATPPIPSAREAGQACTQVYPVEGLRGAGQDQGRKDVTDTSVGTITLLRLRTGCTTTLAVEAVLETMRTTSHPSVVEALKAMRSDGVPAYKRMVGSEDATEGPHAYAEGREPNWLGC